MNFLLNYLFDDINQLEVGEKNRKGTLLISCEIFLCYEKLLDFLLHHNDDFFSSMNIFIIVLKRRKVSFFPTFFLVKFEFEMNEATKMILKMEEKMLS
jgi:hypothetical protein